MKCYRCQGDNPENATHCGHCGAKLSRGSAAWSWVSITVGVILMAIFVPAGLCFAAFSSGFHPSMLATAVVFLVIGAIGLALFLRGIRSE